MDRRKVQTNHVDQKSSKKGGDEGKEELLLRDLHTPQGLGEVLVPLPKRTGILPDFAYVKQGPRAPLPPSLRGFQCRPRRS